MYDFNNGDNHADTYCRECARQEDKEIESLKEQLEEARSDIEIMMMASNQVTVQHLGRQCLEKYKRGEYEQEV